MRIWDVHPGYLNRQSLLGEHRELHGMLSIITQGKKGYSRHPETLRWVDHLWALKQRHQLLAAEMQLRGYQDHTPVHNIRDKGEWPSSYIDPPYQQLKILESKYQTKESGRLRLPLNAQQLWSQHKYSVMARDTMLYQQMGRQAAQMKPKAEFSEMTLALVEILRVAPSQRGIINALEHMWGYVDEVSIWTSSQLDKASLSEFYVEVQNCAKLKKQPYLMNSTSLSELKIWITTE